jgi:hypothetical protein
MCIWPAHCTFADEAQARGPRFASGSHPGIVPPRAQLQLRLTRPYSVHTLGLMLASSYLEGEARHTLLQLPSYTSCET